MTEHRKFPPRDRIAFAVMSVVRIKDPKEKLEAARALVEKEDPKAVAEAMHALWLNNRIALRPGETDDNMPSLVPDFAL